jgi:hypothetical protein
MLVRQVQKTAKDELLASWHFTLFVSDTFLLYLANARVLAPPCSRSLVLFWEITYILVPVLYCTKFFQAAAGAHTKK